MKKVLKWVVFGILLTIFIIIMICIKNGKIIHFDNITYTLVTYNTNTILDNINHIFTFFGSTIWMVLLALILLITIKDKKKAIIICGCLIISILLNIGIKNIFMRERPLVRRLVEETSFSFPSGHTTAAVSLYGIILFFIIKSNLTKSKKIIYSIGLIMLMFFIGFSRIYLGAHFASDVIGAIIISSAFLILYTAIIEKFILKNRQKS